MYIVSYDISNDRLRTKFSKFLKRYGRRLQYSVFEIKNSPRILKMIITEIESKFGKKFKPTDSVLIFSVSPSCVPAIYRFGSAVAEEKELILVE